LCGGNCDGSTIVFMGIVLEGFTLFSFVHLLTIMVTIFGCIQCYGVVVYVSNHLLVTVYLFHLVVVLFCGIGINTVGYGVAIMPISMI
jgi:hypothetical protein